MHKDTYDRRKQQGLCPLCGDVPSGGFVNCSNCRALNCQKSQDWRKKKIFNGRCANCGKPNPRGGRECVDCTKEKGRRSTARSHRRQVEQTCTKCGEPRYNDSKWCLAHKEARKVSKDRWRQVRIAEHRCVQCGFGLPENWKILTYVKCVHRSRAKTETQRREVIEMYGSKCACCGESNFYFLTLDHVNNNGAEERKQPSGQNRIWARLRREKTVSPDYQILCYNYNCAKGHLGSCPHTWEDSKVRPVSATRGTLRLVG